MQLEQDAQKVKKNCNVVINENFFFDQLVKTYIRTYDNIRKIMAVQGDDFVTGCLLSYPYFKEHYYMIAIDLSKHQALDADPKCYKKLFLLQI